MNLKIKAGEFISLMAVLMSLIALAIDAMMPALDQIASDLNIQNSNNTQMIISFVFLGMAPGQMLYGPLSDSFGRKKSIQLGIAIFLLGSLVSFFSSNFTVMLAGRILQGFGAAACRVVPMAMVRDQFSGREMGRIMSLIMVIFIIVPALAPAVGQLTMYFYTWRAIFGLFVVLGIASALWLYFRQPETLPTERRLDFSFKTITAGITETLKNPVSRGYTIAAGFIFGAFVGYLSSAQKILQIQYKLGDSFSIYFGCLALSIGLASFTNSRLVMKYGMEKLSLVALWVLTVTSSLFFLYVQSVSGHPPLSHLMVYLLTTFFCIGILFGNFNALAAEPLGHIAGVANSVISSVQTLMSFVFGGIIGQSYDGTVRPLVSGFFALGAAALLVVLYTERKKKAPASGLNV